MHFNAETRVLSETEQFWVFIAPAKPAKPQSQAIYSFIQSTSYVMHTPNKQYKYERFCRDPFANLPTIEVL